LVSALQKKRSLLPKTSAAILTTCETLQKLPDSLLPEAQILEALPVHLVLAIELQSIDMVFVRRSDLRIHDADEKLEKRAAEFADQAWMELLRALVSFALEPQRTHPIQPTSPNPPTSPPAI
jgi:hypothetical protein